MGAEEPRLAGYRLIKELATGLSSTIYLAENLLNGQHHAIKIFDREHAPIAAKHWLAEVEVLSRIVHPNLARLQGFGQTLLTNRGYLALEYIQGQDFVSASTTVSQHHFYAMLAQLCRVLDYLHRRGITHGDLKPQNILVIKDLQSTLDPPTVKVIDLAFAGSSPSAPRERFEASPHYVSPEVIEGSQPTMASDLYSVGVILYESLAGCPPFPGDEVGSVLHRHLRETPARIDREVMKELHPIIYQLLQKDPPKRPSSPWELLRLINASTTVGHFQLNTPDTWSAQVSVSSPSGRDSLLSELTDRLSHHLRRSDCDRPLLIAIRGFAGAGKTQLLTYLAIRARALGYRIFVPPLHDLQLDMGELVQAMRTTLSDPAPVPLLLVCDALEINHGDHDLLTFITSAESQPTALLLSVNTSRVTLHDTQTLLADLGRRYEVADWTLQALDSKAVADATRVIAGTTHVDPAISAFLSVQSGGHPSLFKNLLLALLDQGIVTSDGYESMVVRGDFAHVSLPNEILLELEQLWGSPPPEEARLLRALALANDPLGTSEIACILGCDHDDVRHIVERLEHRGILRADGVGFAMGYFISSELMRTKVVHSLDPVEERTLHEALARWYLSAQHKPHALDHAASHFVQAKLRPEAILYCLQAGQKAEIARDSQRAAHFYRSALDQDPDIDDTRIEATLGLARALCSLSRPLEAQKLLHGVQAEGGLTSRHLARVMIQMAECALKAGDLQGSESAARSAESLAKASGWEVGIIEAMLGLGLALCWQERRKEGCSILFEAASTARRTGHRELVAEALCGVAFSHWKAGNYQRALNYERRGQILSRSSDRSRPQSSPGFNIGMLRTQLGRYAESRATLRAEIVSGFEGAPYARTGKLHINIGETYRIQGRWRSALKHYGSARQVLGKLQTSDDLPIAESNLAHTFVLTGFYTVARHLLRNKARNVTKSLSAHVTCSRQLTLATLLLSLGSPEKSRRLVRIARQLAQRANYGQLFLELSVLLALSSVKLGASSEIRSALSEARGLFGGLAPFDVKLSASLALAEIESTLGSSVEGLHAMLMPTLEKARAKKMRWHLAWGLRLWGEALLGASRADEAEGVLREAAEVSRKSVERPGYWQAMYLLGRAYEQMLKSERALACYRVATLTINELAMDIEEERYKTSFLAQPRVREAMERYERLRAQVGKKARRDIAALSLSERASRKMLGALGAIGQKLTSILELDELMTSVLDLAIENVRAERGIIFLRDEVTSEVRPDCARNMDKESIDEVSSFSRSVIDQAIQGRTLLTVDVGKDPTLSAYKSLVLHEIKSILCVPMKARGKVVGAIYLDTRRAAQMFTDRERTFVESFASQAAIAIENARLFGQMNAENARLRKEVEGRTRFENLIGTSAAMRKLTEVIAGVLESDCNVLILGESGTGKELVARAIHYNGPRRTKKFVAIDCGALPENLLEAELFGYARGAFTGADRDRIGLIEEAHGGTLFLDEITNTSMALQARLLRVIQEHEVRRVGENSPRHVDVRLVAASNADVRDLLAKGRFRQDLYYRLNVVTIEVPPLRQRKEDIPLLVNAFLGARARNDQPAKRLGPGVLEVLARHDWPGNVRELENAVERMVVLASSGTITADDLPDGIRPATNPHSAGSNGNGDGQKSGEQIMIEEALRRHTGDKAKAARFIGWNRQKLYRRMKAFRIPADFGREG